MQVRAAIQNGRIDEAIELINNIDPDVNEALRFLYDVCRFWITIRGSSFTCCSRS
jgi:hypothetical protein